MLNHELRLLTWTWWWSFSYKASIFAHAPNNIRILQNACSDVCHNLLYCYYFSLPQITETLTVFFMVTELEWFIAGLRYQCVSVHDAGIYMVIHRCHTYAYFKKGWHSFWCLVECKCQLPSLRTMLLWYLPEIDGEPLSLWNMVGICKPPVPGRDVAGFSCVPWDQSWEQNTTGVPGGVPLGPCCLWHAVPSLGAHGKEKAAVLDGSAAASEW